MITSNHYAQQHNMTPPPPPQQLQYHNSSPTMMHMQDSSTCTPVQSNFQTHMQVELNGGMSSCHYQHNYNVVSDCSPTADSGIQSIADSPPADPFTPPTPYIPPPPITAIVNKSKETQPTTDTTNYSDDYSDMPRLIPFHQMEAESGSPLTEEPPLFTTKTPPPPDSDVQKSTEVDALLEDLEKNSEQNHEAKAESQEKIKKESDDDITKIAITPAMNVTDLVEQLMSHMDPQQRKQFASAIQSKVATDDTTAVDSSTVTTTATITNNPDNSDAVITTADIVTSVTVVPTTKITTTINAATICDNELMEIKESENEVAVQTEFVTVSKARPCEDENIEDEIPELRSRFPERKRKARKRKVEECNES
ncbi:hypothetical protein WUBG_15338, partial [Wuchereria bancrofti]